MYAIADEAAKMGIKIFYHWRGNCSGAPSPLSATVFCSLQRDENNEQVITKLSRRHPEKLPPMPMGIPKRKQYSRGGCNCYPEWDGQKEFEAKQFTDLKTSFNGFGMGGHYFCWYWTCCFGAQNRLVAEVELV